jgi:hypothetical protein
LAQRWRRRTNTLKTWSRKGATAHLQAKLNSPVYAKTYIMLLSSIKSAS